MPMTWELLPGQEFPVVIQRPNGCDVWPVLDGREFKFWKQGHRKSDGFPQRWAERAITTALAAEKAESDKEKLVRAEKEPAKIDALLAFAKSNPKECGAELDGIARKKRGAI